MPTYNTPTPIDLAINLPVGALPKCRSGRHNTGAELRPAAGSRDAPNGARPTD